MAMNLNDHEWAGEIDMVAGNWRIPGERMKSGRPHVVRLCERAVALLATMPREGEQSTDPVAYTDPRFLNERRMVRLDPTAGNDRAAIGHCRGLETRGS